MGKGLYGNLLEDWDIFWFVERVVVYLLGSLYKGCFLELYRKNLF